MDPALDELLMAWETLRAAGEPASTEALCAGRPELAAELERCVGLLEACDRLLSLDVESLESIEMVSGSGPTAAPARRAAPAQVGDYRVLHELGHGGMGVV